MVRLVLSHLIALNPLLILHNMHQFMQQSCYIVRFVKFIVNLNELFFTINLSESIGIIITQVGVINLNVALNLIMRGEELVHTMSELVVNGVTRCEKHGKSNKERFETLVVDLHRRIGSGFVNVYWISLLGVVNRR